MDVDRIKAELLAVPRFAALAPEDADAIADRVSELLKSRFAGLPEPEAFRVARRAATWLAWRVLRRQSRERERLRDYAVQQHSARESDPSEEAAANEAEAELRQALRDSLISSLTPEERLVVFRRFVQGDSVERVAAEMGVSEQHVYYLSRRALAILRRRLDSFRDLFLDS